MSNKHTGIENRYMILLMFILIYSTVYINPKGPSFKTPPPVDVINKKKNKKLFKKERQVWMENMHRVEPGLDWRLINKRQKDFKIKKRTDVRKNITQIEDSYSSPRRDIPGQWFERGSNNQAGRIRVSKVDFTNQEIYCASSGGNIWRGNIDGSGWTSLNDYFQIKGIHFLDRIFFNDVQRMILVNNKNCFFTENDAYTIEESNGLENIENWGWIFRAIVKNDNQQTIYLGAIEWDYSEWTQLPVIYKSVDGGNNFVRILELSAANGFSFGTNNFDIWAPEGISEYIYVLNDGICYKLSSDDALDPVGSFSPSNLGNNILIGGQSDNGTIFLHARVGERLYSSIDSGISWVENNTLPSSTFTINSFECSTNDSEKLAIGSIDGYKTSNGGETWELINNWWEYYSYPESKLHADIPEFNYLIDPSTGEEFQLISTDGGIYISFDHFNTVQNLSLSGLGVSQYYSTYTSQFNPYNIFAGSQDQGFQRHLSTGEYEGVLDFEQTISGDYGHIVSGDSGISVWTDYPGFVMFYSDVANSTNMTAWDFEGEGYLWLPPLMIDPFQSNIVYIGGGGIESQNHMVKVTSGISGMTAVDMPFQFDSKISSMAFSPLVNNNWYVSTEDGKFYYSTTAGETFNETSSFTGPESHYFYGSTILPSPIDSQRVYIGGSGYSNPAVYVSDDGGETFSAFDNGLPNTLVYQITCLPDESMIFAATEIGPYVFSNEAGQWRDLTEDTAPDQSYWSVEYIEEIYTVRFGTYGRGIWDYTFPHNPITLSGDINDDTIVNIQDLIDMIQIIFNFIELSDYIYNVGDFNNDNSIDIIDLLSLADILDE